MSATINIEIFSCSGGMAEGFRRAGIHFDFVFDYDPDACQSYERNLKHRPVRMDVRDLLRMVRGGWRHGAEVGLLVADPPCTPWSRAGKRLGTDDERDMLEETADLISILRPRAYLIGNVPGLQDSTPWGVVQRVIGGLQKFGYCVADYVVLDAADYGVPQHRIRPFWFGHLAGPCVRWPVPTHGDPSNPALPGLALKPWVTCRQALQHLPVEELGRPVRLKRRDPKHPPCEEDQPGTTVRSGGNGNSAPHVVLANARHSPASPASPASTIGAKDRGQSTVLLIDDPLCPPTPEDQSHHTVTAAGRGARERIAWPWDRPATTICKDERIPPPGHHDAGSFMSAPDAKGSKKKRPPSTKGPQWSRISPADAPSPSVLTDDDRIDKIAPAGEHAGQFGPNAVILSERAAAILQGFPEGWSFCGKTKKARWSMLGQAMPAPLAHAVAMAIVEQISKTPRATYRKVKIRGRTFYAHRIVAERMVGRPLESGEQVHHRNGVKDDNREANLEVLSAKDHGRHHFLKNPISKVCEVCARTFEPPQAHRARDRACSLQCRDVLVMRARLGAGRFNALDIISIRTSAESLRACGRRYDVTKSTIKRIRAWPPPLAEAVARSIRAQMESAPLLNRVAGAAL